MADESNVTQSDSTASIYFSTESKFGSQLGEDSASLPKNKSHEEAMIKHAKTNSATSYSKSNYYCSGHGGSFMQSNDRGHSRDDGSCMHPVSDGSKTLRYSRNSTYVIDVANGNATLRNGKQSSTLSSANFDDKHSTKSPGNFISRSSNSTSSQPINPVQKVSRNGIDFMAGHPIGYRPAAYSSDQKEAQFPYKSQLGYRAQGSSGNGNSWRGSLSTNKDFETSLELVRGPRAFDRSDSHSSSVNVQGMGFALRKDQYNLPDLKIEYMNAKFYVIKSYSEDDVHKSIKYSVWSSTPHGNKKLDVAFDNAEKITIENGTNCPVFLFFSVNKSGQFVGLAEMVGPVDFNKDMNFWQVDEWRGFFPVKWHIIKDVPHSRLQHIILNDGRDVTYTRDTHEIGVEQGLQMLNIFKSYKEKTSLLDDFSFYDNREKSLQKSKASKPKSSSLGVKNVYSNSNHAHQQQHNMGAETRFGNNGKAKSSDLSSLNKLTEKLSLNGYVTTRR